ncbi:MAG: VOC family protein [Chloroflexi bacterium]|nr:VOC family protein [Chloroflexota bacterium]
MDVSQSFPHLRQVVLDTTNARELAEFYRELLGYTYRAGDEPPAANQPDPRGREWLVIQDANMTSRIAFQQVDKLPRSTWPADGIPQQLHLDLSVPSIAVFDLQHQRAQALGATLVLDRSKDEQEPLRVYADPAGHPFCIFVLPG